MLWKTRGTARREAAGEKRVKRYLEFAFPFHVRADTLEGIVHTTDTCKAIKAGALVRCVHVWENDELPENTSEKIGRGAWIKVNWTHLCPHCSNEAGGDTP